MLVRRCEATSAIPPKAMEASLYQRVLLGLIGIVVVGLLGFVWLAWQPAIAPIAPPAAASFPPELVAKGESLAGGGYCSNCHTVPGGAPFAGGYAMHTSFGTIYSTNITPDPETGIGTWSEAAFARALHKGVARDGSHLFPAFPYDHFTKLSDDDVKALYAYMMTRPAVRAPAKANGLPFPLGIRALQAGWKLLFFHAGPFEPDATKSAEWNRGAYLAQGLGHCGACHTPRNVLGAEKRGSSVFAGAEIDDWIAPALTDKNPSPAPWTVDELHSFLSSGVSALHGTAAGPMAPVSHGLAAMPDADIHALAVYIADIDGAQSREAATAPAVAHAMSLAPLSGGQIADEDARLYTVACASCHYNSGTAPNPARPDLALNSALHLSEPTNLIQVIFHGIGASDGMPGVVMPDFVNALSDDDVAKIVAYLRRTRTDLPPWTDLGTKIAEVRKEVAAGR